MVARNHRQGEQAGPGWLPTLGGAALLLVAGFAVGLVAGSAWEEPDLVLDHLAGRTTEVPLAAEVSAGPAEAPEPASLTRPLGDRESAPTASQSQRAAEPPSVSAAPPPRPPAPPAHDGYSIQVGAFGQRVAATRLAGELRADGFSVYVHIDEGRGGARFRVRVGPVPTRKEATRLARKLESDHQLPTWILSPDSH